MFNAALSIVLVLVLLVVVLWVRSKNDQNSARYGHPTGAHTFSAGLLVLAGIVALIIFLVVIPWLQNNVFCLLGGC